MGLRQSRRRAGVGSGHDSAHGRPAATDPERQHRLATVVVGGGGATGIELAGELAEMLPAEASRHGLAPDRPAVWLIEASPPSWPAPPPS
jgi:NADH dehydrogenase FAD-containing subunit